jgi:predicted O-methyltransferase YrrM
MNEIIDTIFKTGTVRGRSEEVHELHSAIDPEEGEFLCRIIQGDESIAKTLEIGCGFGLSSLFICSAIQGRNRAAHIIIDPFQNTQWDGVGIRYLEEAGYDFFTLIEKKSEVALPQLLEELEGRLDFVFIDGWHTFDHTLLDCFYATRLLRVGGYLALDDVCFPSVGRAVAYLINYPCYELYGSVDHEIRKTRKRTLMRILLAPVHRTAWGRAFSKCIDRTLFEDRASRMVALKKVTDDNRNWNWHTEAF